MRERWSTRLVSCFRFLEMRPFWLIDADSCRKLKENNVFTSKLEALSIALIVT
jgi:hypothetical protein